MKGPNAQVLEEFTSLCKILEEDAAGTDPAPSRPATRDNGQGGEAPKSDDITNLYDRIRILLIKLNKLGLELERLVRDPITPDNMRVDLTKFDSQMQKLYMDMYAYTQKLKEDTFGGGSSEPEVSEAEPEAGDDNEIQPEQQ